MPLNRPALALSPGPRGVQDARRWAGDVCAEVGRPELVECAQLGISELVTNALLHARPPIELRLRGTREHPRIEVSDTSTEAPEMPSKSLELDLDDDLDGDLDDLLLTFGRGLSIVARAAVAWGVDIEVDGKVVWFEPADDFSDDDGTVGVVTGETNAPATRGLEILDPVVVHVLGVPLKAYSAFDRHLRELRREVRLLALAHESAYPLAKDLSDLFGSLERHLREVIGTHALEEAASAGRHLVDLEVPMARSATRSLSRFIELLDLADEFCREERLLSLARTPEQRRFQRWFLGEFVRQGDGREPIAWTEVESTRRSVVS